MKKGFVRRLFGFLGGALIVLGLPGAFSFSRPSSGPGWWEIRLTIIVRGDYALAGGAVPVSGKYTCRARWEGRLHPDGDDFLLVHLKTEILEWDLAEKASLPVGEHFIEATGNSEKPAFRLNYILRDGQAVEVDFDLAGITVPLHDSRFKAVLEFPESSGRGAALPVQGYAAFVSRGTNRVLIPASDLERRAPERTFSWEWRRTKRVAEGSRSVLFTQHHTAEAVVVLVGH
jgi:hypothetical protein